MIQNLDLLSPGNLNFSGTLDTKNPESIYKFSLNQSQKLNLQLNGGVGNADLYILDASGKTLYNSATANTSLETLNNIVLETGNYAIRVVTTSDKADYNLAVKTDTLTGIDYTSGVFTVGNIGKVGVDWLADGGAYVGEVAVVSLNGFTETPGTPEFNKEMARRALSNSDLGHIVISDHQEAAKYDLSASWEGNFNFGIYPGPKTVQMKPGDKFAVMLVPNGRVQSVFNNPSIGGNTKPLYSLATANPLHGLHFGQIGDLSGDGHLFAMEDIRVDQQTDFDYNDVIFRVKGARGEAPLVKDFITPGLQIWTDPNPTVNQAPINLGLGNVKNEYLSNAPINFTGAKVFDGNGAEDIAKVTVKLTPKNGNPSSTEISTFTSSNQGWADFNYSLDGLKPGEYTIQAVAADQSKAVSNTFTQNFVVKDPIPPNQAPINLGLGTVKAEYSVGEVISFTGAKVFDKNGADDLAKVTITLTPENGTAITKDITEFTRNADNWADFTYSLDTLAAGKYTIKAIAYDQAGAASNTVNHSFNIADVITPNQAPINLGLGDVQSVYSVKNPINFTGARVFDKNGADDIAKVVITVTPPNNTPTTTEITTFTRNADNWADFNYSLDSLILGNYTIQAIAYDKAGVASNTFNKTFLVDQNGSGNVVFNPLNPTISVTATDAEASETPDSGSFRIQRAGGDSTKPLTVSYTLEGTAINGTDYQQLPTTVTIPAGQNSADIPLSPRRDDIEEPSETAILKLTSAAAYNLGANNTSATVTIANVTDLDRPSATNLNQTLTYTEDTPLKLTPIQVTDPDGETRVVIGVPLGAGTFSTGTSGNVTSTILPNGVWHRWRAIGKVADVNNLLANLTFTPALNYNKPFIGYSALGDEVSSPVLGDINFTGIAVNDAPTLKEGNLVGAVENRPFDITYAELFAQMGANDVDGDTLTFQIDLLKGGGTLTKNGVAVTDSATLSEGDTLTFTPSKAGTLDIFSVRAKDSILFSSPQTCRLTVSMDLKQQWAREWPDLSGGGNGGEKLYYESSGIARDSKGNAYVTGWARPATSTRQPDDLIHQYTGTGSEDSFLLKYNSTGDLQWGQFIGNTGYDSSAGVAIDSQDNVYVAGTKDSLAKGKQVWVGKYDGNGTTLWNQEFGTAQNDFASGIAITPNYKVAITGYTNGDFNNSAAPAEDFDFFLAQYDALGTPLLSPVRQWGSSDAKDDFSSDLAINKNNGTTYIAGTTLGTLGTPNAGGSDAFLATITTTAPNNPIYWQLGSPQADSASDVAFAANGKVYVTGNTNGKIAGQANNGGTDIWFGQFDAAGQNLSIEQKGTETNDVATAIAADVDNDFLISVNSPGNWNINGPKDTALADAWLLGYSTLPKNLAVEQLPRENIRDVAGGFKTNVSADGLSANVEAYITGNFLDGRQVWTEKYSNSKTYKNNPASCNRLTSTRPYDPTNPIAFQDMVITDPDPNDTITTKLTIVPPSAGTFTPPNSQTPTANAQYNPKTGELTVTGAVEGVNSLLQNLKFNRKEGFNGQAIITTSLTDNVMRQPLTGNITLTGEAINQPPNISDATFSGAVKNQPLTITYDQLKASAQASDINGDAIVFKVQETKSGTLTKGGQAVAAGTSFSAGESLVWTGNAAGAQSAFTFIATDNKADSPAKNVNVNVLYENTISVAATTSKATEDGVAGQFTVTRTGATTEDLIVNYSVANDGTATNGADYNLLPLTVTIPAGKASASIDIVPKDDLAIEGTEQILLSLKAGNAGKEYNLGTRSAVVEIVDNDSSSITQFGSAGLPDAVNAIVVDASGSVYTAGFTGTTKEFWFSKSDSKGNELWKKPLTQEPTGMVFDDGGDVVIAGTTNNQVWVTRYDANGNVKGDTKTLTELTGNLNVDIAKDGSGNFYLTGGKAGESWVAKYDKDFTTGELTKLGASINSITGVAVDDSSLYISYKDGSGVSFVNKYALTDSDLINPTPTKAIGIATDEVTGIAVNSSGVYLTGSTEGQFSGEHKGGKDAWVGYYNDSLTGNLIKSYQAGTTKDDVSNAVAISPFGGVYIAGSTNGNLAKDNATSNQDGWFGQIW